jgi:hypothetical protein
VVLTGLDHQRKARILPSPNNMTTVAALLANAHRDFLALTAVDVVGLQSETHGRSCDVHMCCGHHVGVNDKLVCIWQVQQIDERTNAALEEVVQVHKIGRDGLVTCHVGYLPKRLFCKHGSKRFDLMFLKVKHDLRCSDNSHERQRSHRNYGMVLCDIIRDNDKYNSHNPFEGDPCDVSVEDDEVVVATEEEEKTFPVLFTNMLLQLSIKTDINWL